jgi:predicted RNA-binding Zn-ribbon protein involved in translation (DUF1610 family)
MVTAKFFAWPSAAGTCGDAGSGRNLIALRVTVVSNVGTLWYLTMAKYKYEWRCPTCGTQLELKMRITQTKRRCPQCATLVTPEEIDRQEMERQRQSEEWYARVRAENAERNRQQMELLRQAQERDGRRR